MTNKEVSYKGEAISHSLILQRKRSEVRRLLRIMRKIQKHNASHAFLHIDHDSNQSCCFTERWPDTLRIVAREFEDRGLIGFEVGND